MKPVDLLVKNDLLYHATHGLCRVMTVIEDKTKAKDYLYALLPETLENRSKIRFTLPHSALALSGFNRLISEDEAQAILEYFQSGRGKVAEDDHAWALAISLREEARSTDNSRDARRSLKLKQLTRALVGELACALKCTLREISQRVQQKMDVTMTINPMVLTAFASIERE